MSIESKRGLALLIAMAVVAALGMISLTGFALALQERAVGLGAVAEIQAEGAADAALADAMAGWPASQTPLMPGQETALATVRVPGPAVGQAAVRNLGGPIFLLRATGVRFDRLGTPIASTEAELLVRLDSAGGGARVNPRKYPLGWRRLP
jgi:hypothetical protein